MTERERILASFSAAEIEIYRRMGGVASREVEAEWAKLLMDVPLIHPPRKVKPGERTERRVDRKPAPAVVVKRGQKVAA